MIDNVVITKSKGMLSLNVIPYSKIFVLLGLLLEVGVLIVYNS
jgi:hypothetical protein